METSHSEKLAELLELAVELSYNLQIAEMFAAAKEDGDVSTLLFDHYQRMENRLKTLQQENESLTRQVNYLNDNVSRLFDEKQELRDKLYTLQNKVILRWP